METVANAMENPSVLEKSIYDIGGEDLMDFWKEELVVPFNNVNGQSTGGCGAEDEEATCTPPNDDYYKFIEHGYISNSSTTDSPNGYPEPTTGMYAVTNELLTDFYEREQAVRDCGAAFSWSRNFSFPGVGASVPEAMTAVKGEHSYSFGVKHPVDLNGAGTTTTHLGLPGLVPGPTFSVQLADVPGNRVGVASSGGTSPDGSEDSLPDSPFSSVQDDAAREVGYSATTITSPNRCCNQSAIPMSAYQEERDQDVVKQHRDEGADGTTKNSSRSMQPVSVQDVRSSPMVGTSGFALPHGRIVVPSGDVNIQLNAKSSTEGNLPLTDAQLPSAKPDTSFPPKQVSCKELSTMLTASCCDGIVPYPEYTVAPSGNSRGKNLNARIAHNWYGLGDDQPFLHAPKPSMMAMKKPNVIRSLKPSRRVARHPIKTPLISTQLKGAVGPLHLTSEEKRTLISEGYSVPLQLPLTKSEEKSLKKIRRKIKNKISAQESRRKKKDYMDRLERKMDRLVNDVVIYKKKCSTLESQNATLIQHIKNVKAQLAAVEKK